MILEPWAFRKKFACSCLFLVLAIFAYQELERQSQVLHYRNLRCIGQLHDLRFSVSDNEATWDVAFNSRCETPSPLYRVSWRIHALDQLGWEQVKDLYSFQEAWDSDTNRNLAARLEEGAHWRRPYLCPMGQQDDRVYDTDYFAVVRDGERFEFQSERKLTDHSPQQSTVLFVETNSQRVHWMEPRDLSPKDIEGLHSKKRLTSSHGKGVNFVFLDGSVRFVSSSVDPSVLKSMIGENVRAE